MAVVVRWPWGGRAGGPGARGPKRDGDPTHPESSDIFLVKEDHDTAGEVQLDLWWEGG